MKDDQIATADPQKIYKMLSKLADDKQVVVVMDSLDPKKKAKGLIKAILTKDNKEKYSTTQKSWTSGVSAKGADMVPTGIEIAEISSEGMAVLRDTGSVTIEAQAMGEITFTSRVVGRQENILELSMPDELISRVSSVLT